MGLYRPVMGLLYLFALIGYFTMSVNQKYLTYTYIQTSRTVVRLIKYSQVRYFKYAIRIT
jgi:hypothetical protein